MFIALDENKNRIDIQKADKSHKYFCPICGEELSVKAKDSLAVKPHFAHKRGTECLDTWKHDMSEWHYNWQCMFSEDYREVVVEKNGTKHRADVLINGVVIEFQHSPITAQEIMERNAFYLDCGYQVIWVFDAQNKIKSWHGGDNLDPFKTNLEWKRARREFDIPTPKGVSVFIEYSTEVSTTPPQVTNIMLFLTKFEPKYITFHNTWPNYITKWNLLKQLGFSLEDILSITDILKQHEAYKKRHTTTVQYYVPRRPYRRKFWL